MRIPEITVTSQYVFGAQRHLVSFNVPEEVRIMCPIKERSDTHKDEVLDTAEFLMALHKWILEYNIKDAQKKLKETN